MLDIVLLIFFVIAILRGYFTGFIIQSATLIALIGGIWVSAKFYKILAPLILNLFEIKEKTAHYISFAVLFFGVIIVVHLIGLLITRVMDKSAIGSLNRLAGVGFAIIKMAFILSVVLFLIKKFDTKSVFLKAEWKEKSFLYKPIAWFAPAVLPNINFEKVKNRLLEI